MKISEKNIGITLDVKEMLRLFYRFKYTCFIFIFVGILAGYGTSILIKPTYVESIQIKLPIYSSNVANNTIAMMAKEPMVFSNMGINFRGEKQISIESRIIHDASILQLNVYSQDKAALEGFVVKYKQYIIEKIESVSNEIMIAELEKSNLSGGNTQSIDEVMHSPVIVKPEIVNSHQDVLQDNVYKKMTIGGFAGIILSLVFICFKYIIK